MAFKARHWFAASNQTDWFSVRPDTSWRPRISGLTDTRLSSTGGSCSAYCRTGFQVDPERLTGHSDARRASRVWKWGESGLERLQAEAQAAVPTMARATRSTVTQWDDSMLRYLRTRRQSLAAAVGLPACQLFQTFQSAVVQVLVKNKKTNATHLNAAVKRARYKATTAQKREREPMTIYTEGSGTQVRTISN